MLCTRVHGLSGHESRVTSHGIRVTGHECFPPCTYRQPNRPLMQRLPSVTGFSSGDVAFTISPSCTCSVSVQPTPQYGQIVSTVVCSSSFQVPAARSSYSRLAIRAPVGHTAMQLPQYTHADSGSGTANSVEMRASNPRPATAIANVFWAWSPHASTHL